MTFTVVKSGGYPDIDWLIGGNVETSRDADFFITRCKIYSSYDFYIDGIRMSRRLALAKLYAYKRRNHVLENIV